MKAQINDCTIRDGGYLTGKNSNIEFVKGVMQGLVDAGIDCLETGFLQDKSGGETLVYANSVEARKYLPDNKKNSSYTGFCDNSRYSIENLDGYDGNSFEYFRISFAKHEWQEAVKFAAGAKSKGYKVFVNPMDAPGYTMEERAEIIKAVNEVEPYCFSIVDTFGCMHLDDLQNIFKQVDGLLKKSICIGLHSHDNLKLSCGLAELFIDLAVHSDRDIVVDGSLYGMGRGAGNAATEVIASYMNKKCGTSYDIGKLFDTIEKYLVPMREKVFWGYDLPMFICGVEGAHTDNIYHLQKEYQSSASEIYQVLETMDVNKRKRYGRGYSKTDFSELDRAYAKFKAGEGVKE